jgi:hypothetical protein
MQIPEVSSGLLSPPSSPPLAALNSANELALIPKPNARVRERDGRRKSRREGAAYTIREECERLFCETMKTVFLGEGGMVESGSVGKDCFENLSVKSANRVESWFEVWDYVGGCSFRGFVVDNGIEKSLFVFFHAKVVGRDLKPG